MYFTHSLIGVIVSMYFIGFFATGHATILYIYVSELIPEGYRTFYGTLSNICDGGTMIWASIYFYYVPYWKPLFLAILAIHVVIIIGLLFIPESPIVLYENCRFNESRKVFAKIAKANGVKDFNQDFQFDTEAEMK